MRLLPEKQNIRNNNNEMELMALDNFLWLCNIPWRSITRIDNEEETAAALTVASSQIKLIFLITADADDETMEEQQERGEFSINWAQKAKILM